MRSGAVENHGTQSVVFDKVLPNPLLSHVREAAALCRAEGCDFVICAAANIDSAAKHRIGCHRR